MAQIENGTVHDISGWIIEGSDNVYIRYVGCFYHPYQPEVETEEVPQEDVNVGLIFYAVKNGAASLRVYTKGSEVDIYTRPMVGDALIEIDEDLFDRRFAVIIKDHKYEYFDQDDGESLASALADAYFPVDEAVMTLGQFKAQPTYAQLTYFLTNAEELGYDYIKII